MKIPCPNCNGRGYWGNSAEYGFCHRCNSTGKIDNPFEAIEKELKEFLSLEFGFKRDPMLVSRLRKANFRPDQILEIMRIVLDTCHHCFDSERGCQCWNDE